MKTEEEMGNAALSRSIFPKTPLFSLANAVVFRWHGARLFSVLAYMVGADISVEKYAAGVANELLWALEGLIENESVEEESV